MLCLRSLPLLCGCSILSQRARPPLSHIGVEHKQAAAWIKHLTQNPLRRSGVLGWAMVLRHGALVTHGHTFFLCVCETERERVWAVRVITSVFLYVLLSWKCLKLHHFDKRSSSLLCLFPCLFTPLICFWFLSMCCSQIVVCVKTVFFFFVPPRLLFYSLAFIFNLLFNFAPLVLLFALILPFTYTSPLLTLFSPILSKWLVKICCLFSPVCYYPGFHLFLQLPVNLEEGIFSPMSIYMILSCQHNKMCTDLDATWFG